MTAPTPGRSEPTEFLATEPGETAPGISPPAPPHTARARRARITAVLLAVAFLAVTASTRTHAVSSLDEYLHGVALEHRSPGSVDLARAVTRAGASTWLLLVVLLGGLLAGTGSLVRRTLAAALLTATCVLGLLARIETAHLVGRARPPRPDWAGAAGGFSFPSGHTTAATLGAGLLAWAFARHLSSTPARRGVVAGALAVALVVGWSRVWLGVHWPTDVLGAWLFAGMWLATARVAQLRLLPPTGFGTKRRRPQQ